MCTKCASSSARSLARRRGSRHAFTLVELLAVVAVLVVLFSLLIPSLVRARGVGHQMGCAGKLRAIGSGLLMYLSDQRVYPLGAISHSTGYQMWAVTWGEELYTYIANGKPPPDRSTGGPEFSCPGTDMTARMSNGAIRYRNAYVIHSDKGGPNDANKERGIDVYFYDAPGSLRYRQNRRLTPGEVPEPAGTFFTVDGVLSKSYTFLEENGIRVGRPATILNSSPLDTGEGIEPHSGQNNWLFCDGHVLRMSVFDTKGTGSIGLPYGAWTRNPND